MRLASRERAARSADLGIAGSSNFTVLAPAGENLAQAVLDQAEVLRKEVALQWLGAELAPGRELTHITVRLSDDVDRGRTLLCGPGRALRGDHRMWLTTSRERALGSTLAVIQNGPNNTLVGNALSTSALATVIQNSLDNQQIRTVTTIDVTVNSMELLRAQRLGESMRDVMRLR